MDGRLLPAGVVAEIVPLDGGRVRTLRAGRPGSGVPVVLVHGGGSDNAAISWYRALPALAADREVLALDLPGFGGTEGIAPLGRPEAMADLVARWMAALGVPRAVVCGVSMGGDVVLNLALRHPDLVHGLVLVAPGGLVDRLGSPLAQRAAWLATRLPDPVLLPLVRLANRFTRTALRATVHDPATLPPEVVEEFVREARAPGGSVGYARYNQATVGPTAMTNSLLRSVHRIGSPALLVHGDRDPLVPLAGSRAAAAAMPGARLVVLPGVGHWAQLEASDRFLAEMRAFLVDLG
ncbi:alpha/beta fold hydrolase [Desertihabitans aurantiacus]|uniref:alpha/beta fold hydrolase n=1 Tax=Desertihabitans aurantiacus TaxID=2282477 RepID=UPI000DF7E8F4|nr:alpha/beta fold hydrolase [Desertihabitans aurantiacus]